MPRRLKPKTGRAENCNVACHHHYAASIRTHRQKHSITKVGFRELPFYLPAAEGADFVEGMSSNSAEHVAVIAVRNAGSASG